MTFPPNMKLVTNGSTVADNIAYGYRSGTSMVRTMTAVSEAASTKSSALRVLFTAPLSLQVWAPSRSNDDRAVTKDVPRAPLSFCPSRARSQRLLLSTRRVADLSRAPRTPPSRCTLFATPTPAPTGGSGSGSGAPAWPRSRGRGFAAQPIIWRSPARPRQALSAHFTLGHRRPALSAHLDLTIGRFLRPMSESPKRL